MLPQLVTLGASLKSRFEEIASIWRFSINNGITEGFRIKVEAMQRQA